MIRRKKLLVVSLLAFAFGTYVYFSDRIEFQRADGLFEPSHLYAPNRKEKYFSNDFPSKSDIGKYLADITILHSDPPAGNDVYYFGEGREFVIWRDNVVESGVWNLTSRLKVMTLNGRWRITIVQIFCMFVRNASAAAQQDNCYEVSEFGSIVARGRSVGHEYRNGNIFNLVPDRRPPMPLPRSPITIDTVAQLVKSNKQD